jgi:DNA polymerase-3 subunit chi
VPAEVRFYHLQRQRLEEALPKLMEKVHGAGLSAVIKCGDDETISLLDKALWEYQADSFLPHGQAGDKYENKQPILLTVSDENNNSASVQLIINGVDGLDPAGFDRCLYMFDGRDERIVAKARDDWKSVKASGGDISYWQQKETGGWEQKA